MQSRTLCLFAMSASCALAQSIPTLNFKVDPNWPQLPAGWILQETPGIAADRNEHVFVFSRG
jgi:hypothetical protein